MPVSTKPVECNSDEYVQLTTAQTGYALIQVPKPADRIPRRLGIVFATTKPEADFTAPHVLKPDDAVQRTSDIDNYIWGKLVNGAPLTISVTE